MGIYLSEINMPKGEGSKLVLQIFPNGEVYDGHGIRLGIVNWAKAVPVPPHGRLIDADALLDEGADLCLCEYDSENTWGFSYDMINDAPTIIPEEGE